MPNIKSLSGSKGMATVTYTHTQTGQKLEVPNSIPGHKTLCWEVFKIFDLFHYLRDGLKDGVGGVVVREYNVCDRLEDSGGGGAFLEGVRLTCWSGFERGSVCALREGNWPCRLEDGGGGGAFLEGVRLTCWSGFERGSVCAFREGNWPGRLEDSGGGVVVREHRVCGRFEGSGGGGAFLEGVRLSRFEGGGGAFLEGVRFSRFVFDGGCKSWK